MYANRLKQDHLGQESSNIMWHEIRGMVLGQLYATMEFLLDRNKAPKIITFHFVGNNIGYSHNTLRDLQ